MPNELKPAAAPRNVLIDDDLLVHMTWKTAAESQGQDLSAFESPEDFLKAANGFSFETPIYIDVQLGGGVSGQAFAKVLHSNGYSNIYLATGHAPEDFPPLPWIKKVLGKEPPWS